MKLLYSLMICSLLITACSSGTSTNSNTIQKNAYKPTLKVKLEVSGKRAKVSVSTDMKISAEHYGMARKSGEGHIHMYLDNGEKIIMKEDHFVFEDLIAGKHTLKVSLHNNDHSPYDVTKSIDFEIK